MIEEQLVRRRGDSKTVPEDPHWQRIWELFYSVSQRTPKEQLGYLERVCEGDSELRDEVRELLAEHQRSGDLLDRGLPLTGLHQQVGLAIESIPALAVASSSALAFHWTRAEDEERARHACERAGREAFVSGAQQDAIHWLGQAVLLHRRHGDIHRLGQLERLLGTAHHSLGHLSLCRQHLQRSLEVLGRPDPSGFRLWGSLAIELLRQLVHRGLAAWPASSGHEDHGYLLSPGGSCSRALRASPSCRAPSCTFGSLAAGRA